MRSHPRSGDQLIKLYSTLKLITRTNLEGLTTVLLWEKPAHWSDKKMFYLEKFSSSCTGFKDEILTCLHTLTTAVLLAKLKFQFDWSEALRAQKTLLVGSLSSRTHSKSHESYCYQMLSCQTEASANSQKNPETAGDFLHQVKTWSIQSKQSLNGMSYSYWVSCITLFTGYD